MGVAPGMIGRPSAQAALCAKLRAVILLAGSVRQGKLSSQVGRPVFELPLEAGQSILSSWRRETHVLGAAISCPELPVRIMIDRTAAEPSAGSHEPGSGVAPVDVERDPLDYRGTGGVLRDVADRFEDDELLLVANAAQVLMEPLSDLAFEMAATQADVTIVSHADGTPSGVLLVRCGALRELPDTGFVDMKEQALPMIAAQHRIAVIDRRIPTALPILTLADYIQALRRYNQQRAGKAPVVGPYAEACESAFSIVETDAEVHPSARLHDSVVLRGGRVDAEAVLAHSVVCPGGVLGRGHVAVDMLLTPAGATRQRD